LEKNKGGGSELSPFYHYRYSLLWREWWPKEKVCKSSSISRLHIDVNWSSHCFAL